MGPAALGKGSNPGLLSSSQRFDIVLGKTLRVGANKVPLPKVPGLIMDYWINKWAFLRYYLPQH